MSGTPGAVSLSSVCARLFSIPNHAILRWKGMKSARNRSLSGAVSSALTKATTAFAYEKAVVAFVRALLTAPDNERFLADFIPFQRKIAWFGMLNSLAQTLLKLTAPGVPDIYQGCEWWQLALVDPDNRRGVD